MSAGRSTGTDAGSVDDISAADKASVAMPGQTGGGAQGDPATADYAAKTSIKLQLDLLGHPIQPRLGKSGRPRHLPTVESRALVAQLHGEGMAQPAIAAALRITGPTLRLNYPAELQSKSEVWRRRVQANSEGTENE
ncbi:hypothetical protein [Allopontixanthobacter sp.]|uniref:hypothetical protein n=1 Tax=Allopontixanthobacter sp. TaxID=2906452 RepID=UPI002ABBAD69|nr:hypothetical protein [Allopontixanthobacter sp.]MDZ4307175.1 hypothetical protein [Allopontixanthobacter sp.]